MKMQTQAISVLLQAAKRANPTLGAQFTFEAARKATEATQFQQARDLLAGLLKDSPHNGEYLAPLADTYAQARDDLGLEQFYRDEIATLHNASLPADVRKELIATLRRGLILGLTRMKDYSAAVDQYIELINNFPEDDGLVTEAALYAQRYQRQKQLVDFYTKTVAQSPRDYRWSMVLAHALTNLENYPAAIDIYGKAIGIRPDRSDFYISRAELEERLMRFDDAAADYEHIYQLAYKDPHWMEKVAIIRARQGKTQGVLAALRAALIDGRPENSANYFEVARRLETWGMLDQARTYAEQGVVKAGADLLASSENHAGAKTYVRVMTRLREHEQAYATLHKALEASAAELSVLKEQILQRGVTGLTDAQWRENVRHNRIEIARTGMASALAEMGVAVNTYFTPEERLAFSHFAETIHTGMSVDDVDQFAIPLSLSASLADQEANWRFDTLMQRARGSIARLNYDTGMEAFVCLQRRRGRFAELGSQMEQFAAAIPWQQRNSPLTAAADAYYSAGDERSELRVLASIFSMHNLDANRQQRFFHLLLDKEPQELIRLASIWQGSSGEEAANYAVAHGTPALAHAVVQARSKARPTVWNKSYNGLVGLYFSETTPEVNQAFLGALGDETIAERLGKVFDRDQQLAGNTWFYYGSRYGEYLGNARQSNAEDFLPAILEESPASASGYLTLAGYYAGSGDTRREIEDYNHTLDLSPDRPDVYDSLALAYYKQGNRDAALAQWKQALAVFLKELNSSRVPESVWRDFGHTCDQLRTHRLFSELKPEADAVVRAYLRHNGTWRSNAVLRPVFAAQGNPATATAWLLAVSSSATDPASVLADMADASWIPIAQRGVIYRQILELKENTVTKLDGLARESALQDLRSWQERQIDYLVRTKQFAAAGTAISALSQETRDSLDGALVPLELQVAARTGTLDRKLGSYRNDPKTMPSADVLRKAARQLVDSGDTLSGRKILEMVFARELDEHQLVAVNFLGLAEIRLSSGDTAGALDLLRRLVVVVGSPYENLDPAAALLEKSGHNAEAIEFLDQLVKSAPWEPAFRLRLAKARLAADSDIASVASAMQAIGCAPEASYELRTKAANSLSGRPHGDLGSGELNLLAGSPEAITVNAADKFYYYDARIRAAERAVDPQTKIQLLSHCLIDFPRRDPARIPLFQAAAGARSDNFAIGIIEPLFNAHFLRKHISQPTGQEEQVVTAGEEIEEDATESNASGAADVLLTRTQKARVSQTIGDTMTRLGRIADALSYYENAHSFERSGASRKILALKIANAKSILALQQENAIRQPLLHEALEQDRVVRPRLVRSGGAATEGAVKP
jgi:tetratricopeptide (TPR) repeat protein